MRFVILWSATTFASFQYAIKSFQSSSCIFILDRRRHLFHYIRFQHLFQLSNVHSPGWHTMCLKLFLPKSKILCAAKLLRSEHIRLGRIHTLCVHGRILRSIEKFIELFSVYVYVGIWRTGNCVYYRTATAPGRIHTYSNTNSIASVATFLYLTNHIKYIKCYEYIGHTYTYISEQEREQQHQHIGRIDMSIYYYTLRRAFILELMDEFSMFDRRCKCWENKNKFFVSKWNRMCGRLAQRAYRISLKNYYIFFLGCVWSGRDLECAPHAF